MDSTPLLLDRALAQARADWLAGDPAAWGRYAACLTQLERRLGGRPVPREALARRPLRPGLRDRRGRA
jgi:hypothetical protein